MRMKIAFVHVCIWEKTNDIELHGRKNDSQSRRGTILYFPNSDSRIIFKEIVRMLERWLHVFLRAINFISVHLTRFKDFVMSPQKKVFAYDGNINADTVGVKLSEESLWIDRSKPSRWILAPHFTCKTTCDTSTGIWGDCGWQLCTV